MHALRAHRGSSRDAAALVQLRAYAGVSSVPRVRVRVRVHVLAILRTASWRSRECLVRFRDLAVVRSCVLAPWPAHVRFLRSCNHAIGRSGDQAMWRCGDLAYPCGSRIGVFTNSDIRDVTYINNRVSAKICFGRSAHLRICVSAYLRICVSAYLRI